MEHLDTVVTKLQLQLLILTGLATLIYWLGLSFNEAFKLRRFPTVGSTLPFLSLIGTLEFIKNAHNVLAIGMQKWPGRMFKILTPSGWCIIVTDPKHIDEIRKASDTKLSPDKAVEETLQTRFTFSSQVMDNPFHVPIIKTRLTKSLPKLVPGIYDEILEACSQYMPAEDEWSNVKAFDVITKIVARSSNRIFVGPILCKNPAWIELTVGYALAVVKTAFFLNVFPTILRPVVNYFVGRVAQSTHEGLKLIAPIITARREEMKGGTEKSEDFLTWIMDHPKGGDGEPHAIVERILGLNFAAIHSSSMAATHALFDLAANPEYLEPLREEVEEVTKREGWSKSALDQMHKVDSFLKESQRFHPVGIMLMNRYVLEDYTFSDGTTVPAGTTVTIPTVSVHLNPAVYEDPLKFDGFRFIKMRERAVLDGHPEKYYDAVTVNSEFIAFGQGKHACPGRFFASAEIKLLLAHIIATYDVKLEDGGCRPSDFVVMNTNAPNPTAKIYFRKRQ